MRSRKIKIGIIGCGAIGSAIGRYCADELRRAVKITALFDIKNGKAEALKARLPKGICIASSIDDLMERCSLIVEAASADAAAEVLKKAVAKRKDIMLMSVGGIIDRADLLTSAGKKGVKVYIPSGAICGLDGIKAASMKRIDKVILTTKKPPAALKGAPYVEKNRIDLDSIDKETKLFEGPAAEAVKAFPKNINVSAALSLAGIGAKKTIVRIICSPGIDRNIHEIEVTGEAGRIFVSAENVPSPENPKTSYLAALSAMAVIRDIADGVRIGT